MSRSAGFTSMVVGVLVGSSFVGGALAQSGGDTIRWDTMSVTVDDGGTVIFAEGGMAYASADNGLIIQITGTGTFDTADPAAVTGGGTWTVLDAHGMPVGSGTFSVEELLAWTLAPGTDSGDYPYIDRVGEAEGVGFESLTAGVAVFRVAFANEDGSPGEAGVLLLSCRLPEGSPEGMFEGVTVTKGYMGFWNRGLALSGIDANWTNFYTLSGN